MMIWIWTALALIGTVMNARQNVYGFIFWIISDLAFAIYNYQIDQYAQSFLFTVYLGLAVYGYFKWRTT